MEQYSLSADDMLLFATIVEQGSLVRAANHLGLPKATVSRRLVSLEAGIRQKLLVRTTRRMALTEFGREFLVHCQHIAEEVAGTHDLVNSLQIKPHGRLRVSMPAEYGRSFPLSHAIATFIAQYPEIHLELDMSSRRVDLIGEHYDLAIRMGTLESDSTLVARRIGEQRFGIYASPVYLGLHAMPRHPEELALHHVIHLLPAQGKPGPWRLAQRENTWEGHPAGQVTVNSFGMIQELLLDGTGIGMLPESFALEDTRRGRLVRILADWEFPAMPAWAVMPIRRYLPAKTRIFLAHLETLLLQGGSSV